VRERVEVVRVAAVLCHKHCRLEPAQERGHYLVEGLEPRLVPRVGQKGEVGGGTAALSNPAVLRKARPGEEIATAFMEADGEHLGIALEDPLDAVPVVDVDVHVRDAVTLLLKPLARDRGVVVCAEARGPFAVGVMKAAARTEGVERGAAVDRVRRDEARSDHHCGAFVERVRDGVVGRRETGGV